jgi:hypothetical protein
MSDPDTEWKLQLDEAAFPALTEYASPSMERIYARAAIDGSIGRLLAAQGNAANETAVREWCGSIATDLQLALSLLDRQSLFDTAAIGDDDLVRRSTVDKVIRETIASLSELPEHEQSNPRAYLQAAARDVRLLPAETAS